MSTRENIRLIARTPCWKSHAASHITSKEISHTPNNYLMQLQIANETDHTSLQISHAAKPLTNPYNVVHWLSGCWFESNQRHCVVSLSKTLYSLLSTGLSQEDPSRHD